MEWRDVAKQIAGAAPLISGVLAATGVGAPVAAAVAAAGALLGASLGVQPSPDNVAAALKIDPAAAVKLREIEAQHGERMAQIAADAQTAERAAMTAAVLAVNQTMQTEDKSDHWPTYSWRPFLGFCVGLNTLAASVLVLSTFGGILAGAALATNAIAQLPGVLGALAAINGTVLPILGIASWFRGKAQADPAIPTDNRG